MPGRIVLFGATGYTGRLTAEAMVARGDRPVLAGRNAERVAALAEQLGGLETAIADVAEPASVRALVESGDALVATVGPFARWGDPAVEAAIDAGACYLDSTGEPAFIRRVFERFGKAAEQAGTGLVTAFGYDWVPGNLAGALALREAGEDCRPDRHRLLRHRRWLGRIQRRHAVVPCRRDARAFVRLAPGGPHRARCRPWAVVRRRRQVPPGRLGGLLGALHAATPPSAPAGGERLPGLVRLGLAGDAGVLGDQCRRASRSRGAVGNRGAHAALHPRLDRRAGRAGTRGHRIGGRGDRLRRRRAARVGRAAGRERIRLHCARPRLGRGRAAASGMRAAGAVGPAEAFGLDALEAGCAESGITRS